MTGWSAGDCSQQAFSGLIQHRLGLVGFRRAMLDGELTPHQVSDVADDLSYPHSYDVVHEDLEGFVKFWASPKCTDPCINQAFS